MGRISTRLSGVEAARGLAACIVVIYHAARHVAQYSGSLPLGSHATFGHAGVDFFFVLSGFIILFVHAGDIGRPERVSHYVQRRFTRVFPLYWVALAAEIVVLTMSPTRDVPEPGILLLNVSLLPLKGPIVGVAWTLQLELLFYAVFLVLIANRAAGAVLLALWGCLSVSSFVEMRQWGAEAINALSSPYCLQFFMGMAAALVLRRFRVPAPRRLLIAGTGAFFLAGTLENLAIMDGYDAWPARIVYGLAATAALIGLVESERSGELRVPGPLVALGDASYAIYLFHLLAIGAASQVLRAAGLREIVWPEVQYILLVGIGIGSGVIVSRLVEKPLMRISRRLIAARETGLVLSTHQR